MADFLSMGGYAGYVWTAYSVFAIVLIVDAVAPFLQSRRTLRELRARLTRQAGRNTSA